MKTTAILMGAVLISGAAFGGGAAAAASHKAAPKVIYACAAGQNGALRLVAKPASCTTKETKVSWNRVGIAGAKGATGAAGAAGPAGPTGPSGFAGVQDIYESAVVPASSSMLKDVACPAGTVPLGGGGHFSNVFSGRGAVGGGYVSESDVDESGGGWAATLVNNYTVPAEFAVDAICGAV